MNKPSDPFRRKREVATALVRAAQYFFLMIGLLGLGYYGYVQAEANVFQAYQSWRLEQMEQGKLASVGRFVSRWIPFLPEGHPTSGGEKPALTLRRSLSEGSLIGRIRIPRLNLSAMVLEGTGPRTLQLAVGHIPGTSLPGDPGEVDLAGHRDTFFRELKEIHKGDLITLNTHPGGLHRYGVESISVVSPDDTAILPPSHGSVLNLITCYPFNYIGAAPKRFVVRAEEVDDPVPAQTLLFSLSHVSSANFKPPSPGGSRPARSLTPLFASAKSHPPGSSKVASAPESRKGTGRLSAIPSDDLESSAATSPSPAAGGGTTTQQRPKFEGGVSRGGHRHRLRNWVGKIFSRNRSK